MKTWIVNNPPMADEGDEVYFVLAPSEFDMMGWIKAYNAIKTAQTAAYRKTGKKTKNPLPNLGLEVGVSVMRRILSPPLAHGETLSQRPACISETMQHQ